MLQEHRKPHDFASSASLQIGLAALPQYRMVTNGRTDRRLAHLCIAPRG